jgi:hypothetical protein
MSLGRTLRTPSHGAISWTRTITVLVFAVVSLAFAVMSGADWASAGQAVAVSIDAAQSGSAGVPPALF